MSPDIIPMGTIAVLIVPLALKTLASMGNPSRINDTYRNGRFFLLHIPHFSFIQRTDDEPVEYRFIDDLKISAPLTFIVLPVSIVIIPVFWAVNAVSLSTKKESN